MKIALFLTSLWLAAASLFTSAEKAVLSGNVTGNNGRALSGASVKALRNKALITSCTSDPNGKYRLELDPGTYDVERAAPGYVAIRITGVEVSAKEANTLHFNPDTSAGLEETVVQHFKMSAVNYDWSAGETGGVRSEDVTEVAKSEPSGKKDLAFRRLEHSLSSGYAKKSDVARSKSAAEAKPVPAASGSPVTDGPAYDEVAIDGEKKKIRVAFDPETYEEKVEIMDDKALIPPPGTPEQLVPRAGLLTAGEWNDLHNWNRHWADLLADGEIDAYENMYGFFPKQRYTVLLTNEQGFPIADAPVQLLNRGKEVLWESRTDNTGKAELWAGLFENDKSEKSSEYMVSFLVNGQPFAPATALKPAKNGINRFKTATECNAPKNVDIVWAVDATGSMGDEIEYLKTELLDVIGRARGRNPDLSFRMGTVFYRDVSDAYITKSSGLSYDISKTVDFIRRQSADGGGDYPEAVHSALEEAIYGQKWSEHAIARICFLVLDASPHQSAEVNASLQKSIREAARLGIRIIPVTASGIQKDTEFLMKFFGLATNGTYVFLTDHSGIGGKHLEPTTDEYRVEPLNELLVRLIGEYTGIETCEGKSNIRFDPGQQQGQVWQAQYYPNPASSQFVIDLPVDVQSVTLYDSEGKAVRKIEQPQAGQNTIIISDLSEGFYTIRILKDGQVQSGKLMVMRV